MTNQIDAIELLLADHRTIGDYVERLEASDDPVEIGDLFVRIVDELAAHEAAEREVVYPAFSAALGAVDDTLEHRIGEHEEIDALLAEMRSLAPAGFGFTKRGSALLLEITGHFEREEASVFGRMRAALNADELGRLGSRVLETKQRVRAIAAG